MSEGREMTLDEWVGELPDFHLANKQYKKLKEDNAELEAHLIAIANFIEPHWKGAGVPLESGWMIKELQSMGHTIDVGYDEVEKLEVRVKELEDKLMALEGARELKKRMDEDIETLRGEQ